MAKSRGLSNREGIAADVDELRKRLGGGRHALGDRPGTRPLRRTAFSLESSRPGPGRTSVRQALRGPEGAEQVFFITTPASGFFLKPLATTGRIVITATEPDQEVNETLFPLALAELLNAPSEGIDRDKDGKISVFELYLAVVANVMKRYVDDENLPTEHAKLDDNGDGHGSEFQESYLPPELGGLAGKRAEPKIGPKDDGALASKVPIDAPAVLKP